MDPQQTADLQNSLFDIAKLNKDALIVIGLAKSLQIQGFEILKSALACMILVSGSVFFAQYDAMRDGPVSCARSFVVCARTQSETTVMPMHTPAVWTEQEMQISWFLAMHFRR